MKFKKKWNLKTKAQMIEERIAINNLELKILVKVG